MFVNGTRINEPIELIIEIHRWFVCFFFCLFGGRKEESYYGKNSESKCVHVCSMLLDSFFYATSFFEV